jgi:hypothetical protein
LVPKSESLKEGVSQNLSGIPLSGILNICDAELFKHLLRICLLNTCGISLC